MTQGLLLISAGNETKHAIKRVIGSRLKNCLAVFLNERSGGYEIKRAMQKFR